MKRFIAVLVCIFMLVSLLPAFAFAEEGGSDPIEATPTPTVEPTQEQTKDTTTPAPALTQPVEEQQLTSTGTPENTGTAYTVSVSASPAEGGTASAGLASGATGKEVTLTAAPTEGYQFKEWQVVSGGVTVTDNKFTIGTANVEVKAIFQEKTNVQPADGEGGETGETNGGEGGETPATYTVTVTNDGNGTASANITSGTEGTEVTLTATPNDGYQFKEWQVVSGGVTVTDNMFKIGTAAVVVKAVFEEIQYSISVSPTSLDFDKVQSGYAAQAAQTVTVTNTGNKDIKLTQPASTENYTVGNLSATELAPKATATFTVTPNTGLAAKDEPYSETITVGTDQSSVSASISAKFVVTGATSTETSVSLSKTRIVKGENLSVTAAVYKQTEHKGTIQLYIDGQPYGSPVALTSGNTVSWTIPATDANKLGLGEHTISAKYSGSAAYAPSESSVSKVIVVSPCTPKPPCKPSHYCCGKNHFSGKCVTVRAGEDVTFKVELGCNETCQWYVNKGDGCGFVKIEGATSPRLTLKNVKYKQDGYMYRCIVQNCCDVVSKPIFTLNVASGQLYTPKTGDNGVITVAAGCAAVAALILVGGRRSSRAKQKN